MTSLSTMRIKPRPASYPESRRVFMRVGAPNTSKLLAIILERISVAKHDTALLRPRLFPRTAKPLKLRGWLLEWILRGCSRRDRAIIMHVYEEVLPRESSGRHAACILRGICDVCRGTFWVWDYFLLLHNLCSCWLKWNVLDLLDVWCWTVVTCIDDREEHTWNLMLPIRFSFELRQSLGLITTPEVIIIYNDINIE